MSPVKWFRELRQAMRDVKYREEATNLVLEVSSKNEQLRNEVTRWQTNAVTMRVALAAVVMTADPKRLRMVVSSKILKAVAKRYDIELKGTRDEGMIVNVFLKPDFKDPVTDKGAS